LIGEVFFPRTHQKLSFLLYAYRMIGTRRHIAVLRQGARALGTAAGTLSDKVFRQNEATGDWVVFATARGPLGERSSCSSPFALQKEKPQGAREKERTSRSGMWRQEREARLPRHVLVKEHARGRAILSSRECTDDVRPAAEADGARSAKAACNRLPSAFPGLPVLPWQ